MKKLGLAVLVAVVVVAIFAYLFGVRGRDKRTTNAGDRVDPQYELLTILGDVADRPDDLPGRWRPARAAEEVARMSEAEREKLGELLSLPYLQGSTEAPNVSNVTTYDPKRAYNGFNVYTSGQAPAAYVMDMLGNVRHKWQFDLRDVWPDVPETIHSQFFRRVHAYPNGDVLAIFEGIGLLKLDKDSRLIWAYRGGCHHQAFVTPENGIYVLTRKAQMVPRINPSLPVLPDAVTVLSADGEKLAEYPVLEAIENSPFKSILEGMRNRGDLFHTNSIEVLDGSLAGDFPQFKRGNMLLSLLKLDALVILDPEVGRIVWAKTGRWKRQHDPNALVNGHILVFDNVGNNDKSDVIEFDPRTGQTVWNYDGTRDDPLYSRTCGVARRLANGNTLITESDNGRALEVTSGKDVVWEFYNPNRAGENNELIATLFEVTRVDPNYFPWLTQEGSEGAGN